MWCDVIGLPYLWKMRQDSSKVTATLQQQRPHIDALVLGEGGEPGDGERGPFLLEDGGSALWPSKTNRKKKGKVIRKNA